jgi:hypothetical protein
MKNFLNLSLLLLLSNTLFAQLELPQRSPKASVTYRVGLTDVTVEYSSPSVNKRTIFGTLVPYDKVWRAGANAATNVVFSTDVTIGDAKISKGRYAFFLIPKAVGNWTAIFNSDFSQWGAYQYKQEKDLIRVDVKVESLVKPVERLKFEIDDQGIDHGAIVMEWARSRVIVPFSIETMAMAMANIDKALKDAKEEDKWSIHGEAADFLLHHGGDPDQTLAHAEASVAGKAQVWNTWIKAQAQAKKGDSKGAVETADTLVAIANSNKDEKEEYTSMEKEITAAVANWKKKK